MIGLRMIDKKTNKEIAPRDYEAFAKWTQTIGFRAQAQRIDDDHYIWRGVWLRDDVGIIAETPDGYDSHINALRAAARHLLEATAHRRVTFTQEQIVLLRKGFDAGAPSLDDFGNGNFPFDRADLEQCLALLRDAYTRVPLLELDLTPTVASTLHTCFVVGYDMIGTGTEEDPEDVAREVIDLLQGAMKA